MKKLEFYFDDRGQAQVVDYDDRFSIDVSDEEYDFFLKQMRFWDEEERERYCHGLPQGAINDMDEEPFLRHCVPLIFERVKKKLEEVAIERLGESIKYALDEFDIYMPGEIIYDAYPELLSADTYEPWPWKKKNY